jgi:hypothetical protein
MITLALIFCTVLAALALLQAALIAGAPLGRLAWGGNDVVLPPAKRVASAVSVLLYAAFGYVAVAKAQFAGAAEVPAAISIAIGVIAGYLALGIPMNAISRSRPERLTMTPVSAVLAGLAITLALA